MGRPLRMQTHEETVYHVISRTALAGLPFDASDKDMFVTIVKRFTSIYFAEVLGYCCMCNHFHLVIKMHTADSVDDAELKKNSVPRELLNFSIENVFGVYYAVNTRLNGGFVCVYHKKTGRAIWEDRSECRLMKRPCIT